MPTYLLTNTLRIEDHYNRNKLFPKIKDERKEYRELSVSSVEKYADAYKEFFLSQNRYENYKRFIDDIFHDIRKFNQQIKFKNDKIYRKHNNISAMVIYLKRQKVFNSWDGF